MGIRLEDIPRDTLSPDDVENLANKEFDYADKERVSIREAKNKIQQDVRDDLNRDAMIRANDIFGTNFELPIKYNTGTISEGYGDFTFKEKAFEVAKAGHRGLGSIVKLPGIALKAIGEAAITDREVRELRESVDTFDQLQTRRLQSPIGRGARASLDFLRRTGNKYIETVNGMSFEESAESRAARQQSFLSAPFYRTSIAVSESAPSYGLAVVTSISTGNPNLGLFVLGTTSAGSAYENLRAQQVDPDLALIGALLEGTIEMVTEKVPMDILMKGGGRPFLIRALRLGTAESFQELFAQLGQNYVDAVVKDIDPEDFTTVAEAAKQEWSIISQGWEDAMAAGFAMGGSAAALSPSPDLGFRTADEMRADYGFVPRNNAEIIALTEQIKQKVREVSKVPETAEPLTLEEQDAADRLVATGTSQVEAERIARLTTVTGAEVDKAVQIERAKEEGIKEVPVPQTIEEIGEGEELPRGTSVSVLAQAIEDEIVAENELLDEVPTYKAMNMKEQAEKAAKLITDDIEQAKRIAFYEEPAPPGLFPENVFTGLRVYARENIDVDLIMDLALNEDVVREHTIMGKRIKSLDTDQDFADPVQAIREVVGARKEQMVRKGKDISALEIKLRELQTQLDESKKAFTEFSKKATRQYGRRNTIVTRVEYDKIIERRKEEDALLRPHDPRAGAVYIPNAQDFTDMGKIGVFHLEALGRDFAKWSHEMTRDFGQWITPHLQEEFDKSLKQAETEGFDIKESKRLTTKKKRLATGIKKAEAKIEARDLAKTPRIPIELDAEGQKLQNEYDLAREKLKAAQAVANIITEEEVRIIAQLAKDAANRKNTMENSKRRNVLVNEGATEIELEYGIALSMFLEYVESLKSVAQKRTFGEVLRNYLSNPVDFVSDLAGSMKAAKASLDNSFHLRQGLPTFLKGITGDVQSAKIWWKTFVKSWQLMWNTLKKKKVMRGLFAEMVSDPDYELLKRAKIALNVIEEEIPVDLPSRIPILGMLFRMGENAFVGSARYMRYQLGKQYLNVWRKSGKTLDKRELESLGRLANSQTGRGDIASKTQRPGLLNNLFWSPRNLRAYIDILTLHLFDRNFSMFARRQAATNLVRYISGAAMILAIAKWVDDDSVTWDSNSADFGKIRVGGSRFSVGGGLTVLVVLASRLATREFTSSTTGKTRSIDSGKFGAFGGKELVFNFVENKLSPAAQVAVSLIDQKTWKGDTLTAPQMADDALTPLIIQNVFEAGDVEDSANVLAILMAEALGVNVNTYNNMKKKKSKARSSL